MVLASGKESSCQCRRYKRHGFGPWVRKIPWTREWKPTPVFLPGKFHVQTSLTGYSMEPSRVRHDWVNKHTHKYYVDRGLCSKSENITAIIIIFVQNSTTINFSNAPLKAQDMLVHLLLMLMHRLRNWQKHATLIPGYMIQKENPKCPNLLLCDLPIEIQSVSYVMMTLRGLPQSSETVQFIAWHLWNFLIELAHLSLCQAEESLYSRGLFMWVLDSHVVPGLSMLSKGQKRAEKKLPFGVRLISHRSKHFTSS